MTTQAGSGKPGVTFDPQATELPMAQALDAAGITTNEERDTFLATADADALVPFVKALVRSFDLSPSRG
jgi:hypothetical protein